MKLFIKLVIFSIKDGKLKIFLPEKILPYRTLVNQKSLDDEAKRIFKDFLKLPTDNCYFEQLYTFSSSKRNKVEMAVVYYILIPSFSIKASGIDNWFDCEALPKNISEFEMISYALQRLRWKVEYTNVVYSLLPEEFTFSQLQRVYEAILDRILDKRNFRKKIFSLKLLKSTRHIKKLGKARPAEMFKFQKRELTYAKVL